MKTTYDLKSHIDHSIMAGINDEYLEDNYGHYSPDVLQKLEIDNDYKRRVIGLQIAAIDFLKDCDVEEQQAWVLCRQHIDGDYSYNNI